MPKRCCGKCMMRIYYPEVGASALRDLDVRHFIADCVVTNAEAIVVPAGGLDALYPTKVPYHHVSEAAAGRDLLGEIVSEAQAQGLKVIARIDVSWAREKVWQDHPEWFQRGADGDVLRDGSYYVTCPSAGYQNEAFAQPVLREILSTYPVAGFQMGNPGYRGFCACEACAAAFGDVIPAGPEADPAAWQRFLRWRGEAIGRQFTAFYDLLHEIDDGAFLTAEFAGPEYPDRALSTGQHLPSLSHALTQRLLAAGGAHSAGNSRYWVAMVADQARAVRHKRNPIVQVRAHMTDTGHAHTMTPTGELAHACYQALAHGAGLELTTSSLPSQLADPRTMPTVAELFGFMRQRRRVLETMVPIAHVALVWPEGGLLQAARPETARDEFVGLYHALKSRHILMGVLYDEAITPKALQQYQTVVLPAAAQIDSSRADALTAFARQGGRLVLVDGPWGPEAAWPSLAGTLAEKLGGAEPQRIARTRYALPTPQLPTRLLAWLGPLPLTLPYRRIATDPGADVWLRAAATNDVGVPEDAPALRRGVDPLAARLPIGDGCISYAAFSLGREYLATGHPDLAVLLEAMVLEGSPYKPPLLTDAPAGVEVTLAHWEQGVVVHLVNGLGPAPLERPAPVGPITLDLAWDGPALAELCAPGGAPQALPCEEAWNRVRLVVPRVDGCAQVAVRSG